MLNRFLPWLAALVAFAIVGLLTSYFLTDSMYRDATQYMRLCFVDNGFDQYGGDATDAVTNECMKLLREYESAVWPLFAAIGAGVAAAAATLGIFHLRNRNRAAAPTA